MALRIGIQTWGSEGDIRPFIALGAALTRRGHHVELLYTEISDRRYEHVAAALGFTARAVDNSGNAVTGAPVAVTVGEPDPSTIVHYISDMPWIIKLHGRSIIPAARYPTVAAELAK